MSQQPQVEEEEEEKGGGHNTPSWLWASHVRTKQSKWLEQSLLDMEGKVSDTLQIINEDGDTFAKRAEMYYTKRPELVNLVEESFREYRALSERYDLLSKEMQTANNTIATVCPEKIQLKMDEESSPERSNNLQKPSKQISNVSKALQSKMGQLERDMHSAKAIEVVKEIDRLQKGNLAIQNEKELTGSSNKRGCATENQFPAMQENVCRRLPGDFGGGVGEDEEARKATTSLKSCQETLSKLQEKHAQSTVEAKVDYRKIREARNKLETIKDEFVSKYSNNHESTIKSETASRDLKDAEQNVTGIDQHRGDLDHLDMNVNINTSSSVTEVAAKIDEIVNKISTLTDAVSCQNDLVKRLSSETNELRSHVQNLEEDKDILIEGSDDMSKKLDELEKELQRVKNLKQSVSYRSNNLQTHFTAASSNIDNLSEKLQNAKLDREFEDRKLSQIVKVGLEKEAEEHEYKSAPVQEITKMGRNKHFPSFSDLVQVEKVGHSPTSNPSEKARELMQTKRNKNLFLFDKMHRDVEVESWGLGVEEEDKLKHKNMLVSDLEDKEKLLVGHYRSVLENYDEVKKKLDVVEKKNQDSLFELAKQLRELKNANALKEEQIRILHERFSPETHEDENWEQTSSMINYSHYDSTTPATSTPSSNFSFNSPAINLSADQESYSNERISRRNLKISPAKESDYDFQRNHVDDDEPHTVSNVEERIRAGIDEFLEENLEFWLRFSKSVNKIQRFQTEVHNLDSELWKLRGYKKKDGHYISDARAIHTQMTDIHGDLKSWLKHNVALRDELQSKFSSLHIIQNEILRVSRAGLKGEEAKLSRYQTKRFQGEVLNMKQEIHKMATDLEAGIDCVGKLKAEVERSLVAMDEEIQLHLKQSSNQVRIPLHTFLFGFKQKKQKNSTARS